MDVHIAPIRQLLFAIRTGVEGFQWISLELLKILPYPNLSKLLYLPSEKLSDSSECHFFEPD